MPLMIQIFYYNFITLRELWIIFFVLIILIFILVYIHFIHKIFVISTWIICSISIFLFSVGSEKCVSSINGLCPVGPFAKRGGRFGTCWVIILVLSWFGILSFLGGEIYGDSKFLSPPGIRLFGITLTPVPDKK